MFRITKLEGRRFCDSALVDYNAADLPPRAYSQSGLFFVTGWLSWCLIASSRLYSQDRPLGVFRGDHTVLL